MFMNETFGKVTATRNADGTVTAEWSGPKYVLISQELMHDATQEMFKRDGDQLTICQYHLKILGRDLRGDYVAERIDEGE